MNNLYITIYRLYANYTLMINYCAIKNKGNSYRILIKKYCSNLDIAQR
jgi:hypothetical protein